MKTRLDRIVAVTLTALVWTTSAGAAGVQQRGHEASPHGGQAYQGRGYDPSPARREAHDGRDRHEERRADRDDYRRDDRGRRDYDHRRDDEVRERRSEGGVIMRQPRPHDRWRERGPDGRPRDGYGPYYPPAPYSPYGPYSPPGRPAR